MSLLSELLNVTLEAPRVHTLLFADRRLQLRLQVLQARVVRGHVRRLGLAPRRATLRGVQAEHEGGGRVLGHGAASYFHVKSPFQVAVPADENPMCTQASSPVVSERSKTAGIRYNRELTE